MPLLRDYIAEHERAVDHGREAVRAMDRGELDVAGRRLGEMFEELRSHWQGEENGLFAVMHTDELYAEHIDPLVAEHRELAAFLEVVDLSDPDDQKRVRKEIEELYVHIAKEEDGLFPAALTALDGPDWDAAMAGWQQAHPGRHMIS
ncbi:hemerythrin [Mycolicibacterium peregrinum]|uniref:Hemerythrin domain-containing protein n=1 Tax=Mycolicibacterium peregrinum TaxID=43304 RepID=A0A1X2AQQ8_MYCPR|nr:hemerythrin domain-containing protein [Mycolicibacterium peregrinum]MCV7203287.1 hemerythrin domain-containing protein [Mycolicibacterium peregrinum]ORW53429.1 hemerythrin [Mycolicibacterium peregrinum]OWM09661.1 hemerythrin [Mycolicibacterium peregrinum]TGB40701.1 hemerythrin domain-containing protein [Mycolicibacterium peregrinum]TGB40743.1 hemerythrin domain-containing protein [Mycolicibacterium peregrinum]